MWSVCNDWMETTKKLVRKDILIICKAVNAYNIPAIKNGCVKYLTLIEIDHRSDDMQKF